MATEKDPLVCDECGKTDFKDRRALNGHKKFAPDHEYQRKKRQDPPGAREEQHHMAEYCPACHEKERQLDAKDRQIETVTQRAATAEQTIKTLTTQLAEAQKPTMPTLTEMITHCESGTCAEHKAEWDKLKKKIGDDALANIAKEVLRKMAIAAGIAPEKLVLKVK